MKFIISNSMKLIRKKFSDIIKIKNHSGNFLANYKNFEFKSDENIKETIELLRAKKFNLENIITLKNKNPFIFENNLKSLDFKMQDFFNSLAQRYNLSDKEIKFLVLTSPEAFNYKNEDFEIKEKFFLETLNFKKREIDYIIRNCPKVFFLASEEILNKKKTLEMYFNNLDELEEILKLHPYILISENDRLKRNLYKLSEEGFSEKNYYKIIKTYPIFLFRKPENILFISKFLKKNGMTKNEFVEICTKNPFIFSLDYAKIFLPKIKIFESKGINIEFIINYFIKYPWLITKSRNSILTKFRYIEKTVQTDIINQEYFPKIFIYSYKNFIKPRGELLYSKKKFEWNKIMKLSDEDFCKEYNFDLEELKKLKFSEFHEKEFDYIKIGFLKFLSKEVNDKLYDHPLL